MFNVHAQGGDVMLKTLMENVNEYVNKTDSVKPIVLGVTVLTSMDRQQLNRTGVTKSVKNQVLSLAKSCLKSGLGGVVCSGKEIKLLKRVLGKDFILVVPGVRPAQSGNNDQKRIVTPKQASAWGADYIVVGRPITRAQNRKKAAQMILDDLA
jgi:orotidine-5'-phosphate decarboxylase